MLLYYITDRRQFPGTESEQRTALLQRIEEAATAGIDLVQLREKDLPVRDLERLAQKAVQAVRDHSSTTRLLINSRTDVALATGADGVHLTSTDIHASDARALWAASARAADSLRAFLVAASCHSVEEVRSAESHGADFVVLAPIFEKTGTDVPPVGMESLRSVTSTRKPDMRVEAGDNRVGVPVLALGGVTQANALQCVRAGAAGVAGIRLFQEGRLQDTVRILRDYSTAANRRR